MRDSLGGMTLSVRKVLLHDYPSSLAGMGIPGFWIAFGLLPSMSQEDRQVLLDHPRLIFFPIVVTVLLSIVVAWRLRRTSRLLRSGRASARVTQVYGGGFSRGPFTYYFAFEHDNQLIHALMHVTRWRWRPALHRGQVVDVAYDPTHPTHAIICSLLSTLAPLHGPTASHAA
jgi:hypothetical protein